MAAYRFSLGDPGNGCTMALKHSIACRSRVGDPCDCGCMIEAKPKEHWQTCPVCGQKSNAFACPNCASKTIHPSGLEKQPSPVGRFRATAAEVQAYRQEHQCSMFVAKRNLLARNLRLAIEAAKSVDELKPVLVALLRLTDLQT